MKKSIKIFCLIISVFCCYVFASMFMLQTTVAESYKINKGETLKINSIAPISLIYNGTKMSQNVLNRLSGENLEVELKLFGVIPFSTVDVQVADKTFVQVLGNPFGMKIYTDGVLVIESSDVITKSGCVNPALNSGIKVGDYIKTVNGIEITCNEELSQLVLDSAGNNMKFEILRNGETMYFNVLPVLDAETQLYRIGIWVRDSSAGIGTLTFYSPSSNIICGLGHGICDSDTSALLNINDGEMVEASIVSVEKGVTGSPGALKGKFTYNTLGKINLNSKCGVYGYCEYNFDALNLTEIALKQDVEDGEAQILCTVDGNTPKLYTCEIKKIGKPNAVTQNLSVTVTDAELINATGGIVQGMSGSPILQNGKLVGALTHVLVEDSKKGYGIYAENMLDTISLIETEQLKSAS